MRIEERRPQGPPSLKDEICVYLAKSRAYLTASEDRRRKYRNQTTPSEMTGEEATHPSAPLRLELPNLLTISNVQRVERAVLAGGIHYLTRDGRGGPSPQEAPLPGELPFLLSVLDVEGVQVNVTTPGVDHPGRHGWGPAPAPSNLHCCCPL